MATGSKHLVKRLIEEFAQQTPLRIGSLIVTIFGDSIVPRGGVVWLGSLINTLQPLGVSHRRIRTAVFRLVQDNILTNEQSGRRSFYTLTADGRSQFEEATRRIYGTQKVDWDGRWCLLLTGLLDSTSKTELRKDLSWLGFGQFSTDVLAHPHPETQRLQQLLSAHGCADKISLFYAEHAPISQPSALFDMVANAWDLQALERAYTAYIKRFAPVFDELGIAELTPEDAFYLRTFMIHEYRKVLLRDPGLPDQLLPSGWHGHTAYTLTRDIYRRVIGPAEQYVDDFENQTGPLPLPGAEFGGRFARIPVS